MKFINKKKILDEIVNEILKQDMYLQVALLIESIPEKFNLLKVNLGSYVNLDAVQKYNADDVISYLKNNTEKPEVILCPPRAGDENTVLKIYYYLESKKLKIPVIVLGEFRESLEGVFAVDPGVLKNIISAVALKVNITPEKMMELKVNDYFPISASSYLSLPSAPSDTYALINDNLKKILTKDEEINRHKIEEVIFKGQQNLFVKKEIRLNVTNSISKSLIIELQQQRKNIAEKSEILNKAFDFLGPQLQEFGITNDNRELIEESIGVMKSIAESNETLDSLIKTLKRNPKSYLYMHSMLIAILGHRVIEQMEWGNREQQDKICFIAFFHDITLRQDYYGKIHSLDELRELNLSKEEEENVMKHAINASSLLKDYEDVPMGAETIIAQHHGELSGIGFASGVKQGISPLAQLFMIVEVLASELLTNEEPDVKKSIQNISDKFSKTTGKKIVEAIKRITV